MPRFWRSVAKPHSLPEDRGERLCSEHPSEITEEIGAAIPVDQFSSAADGVAVKVAGMPEFEGKGEIFRDRIFCREAWDSRARRHRRSLTAPWLDLAKTGQKNTRGTVPTYLSLPTQSTSRR